MQPERYGPEALDSLDSSMDENHKKEMKSHSKSYAGEETEFRLRIAEEVERVAAELPPESSLLNLRAITFDQEYGKKGRAAVLFAGTMVGTGQKGVVLVPERTLNILDALDIPYRVVSSNELPSLKENPHT